ncbi:LysM domain-containing protein [Flavobacterium johnsoniae]|uniref:LysM peptidoglycan-binding domain-containing protein n=1 Tax=Flavobacterium johnsoniae TaxID=986 RepID=UPI0025AFF34A|nr:LysM domain-containing protein [Flavobacterium johnsoniae]WJS92801.1 LysM domain-containing protein [Flavobacterium johnsoniae]
MYYTDESELSFYDKFRTYKIEKGETLQSVAQKFGIEARELRRYHNAYCLISDLIEDDFKRYSKFLILAPEKIDREVNEIIEKKEKRVVLGKENKLSFLPRGISRDYSVEYTFEDGGKIDKMGMAIRVKWIATDENKYTLFEITRSLNLFIDDIEPDRIMDELGSKIVEVLYPLKIVVDESGKWIDIYNYDEIVSRWENKKNEIFDYYKKDAEVTQGLIKFSEYALMSKHNLFEKIRSDYFLRSFFNGIHTTYASDYLLQKEVSFPLEKIEESVFKIQQKINPFLNDDNWVEIEQEGEYLNSVEGINFNGKIWIGSYRALYCLNSNSGFIEKMNFECSIDYIEPIKISLKIESLKKVETK